MNIKKIIPLFAMALGLVLALGTVAFNVHTPTDVNNAPMYTFQYDQSKPLDVTSVETNSNWHVVFEPVDCNDIDEAACTITVPQSAVDNPGQSATLKASFNITALESAPGIAYVDALSSGLATNRSR